MYSLNFYSQAHIGAIGGFNLDNDKIQVGLGLNYMLFSKISLGAMALITPFDDGSGDDYMIMYNAKYKLGKFTLVGGLMDMKMGNSPNMDMNMNMHMNHDMSKDQDCDPNC